MIFSKKVTRHSELTNKCELLNPWKSKKRFLKAHDFKQPHATANTRKRMQLRRLYQSDEYFTLLDVRLSIIYIVTNYF